MNLKILTFHRAINYGAVLQAYALYRFISSQFPDTEVCIYDYQNQRIEKMYQYRFDVKNLKTSIRRLLEFPGICKRRKRVLGFVYSNIKTSAEISDNDCFIVGSDQVWNYDCSDFDTTYFLDFIHQRKNKNAYAASFGTDEIPPRYIEQYKKLLEEFNHISVREEAGKKIIQTLFGRDVPVVLDPTLLLNKNDWQTIMPKLETPKKYILVYAFTITDTMAEFINSISGEYGMDVLVLMPSRSIKRWNILKNASYNTAISPEEWLYFFFNAQYIVTNSFHGTVFSIIFDKMFFVELLPPPAKVNSRFSNLLNLFHLQERMIQRGKTVHQYRSIDYKQVHNILEQERKKSLEYLQALIEDVNE